MHDARVVHVVLDERFQILAQFTDLARCRRDVVERCIVGDAPASLLVMTYDTNGEMVATYDEDDFSAWRDAAFDTLLA